MQSEASVGLSRLRNPVKAQSIHIGVHTITIPFLFFVSFIYHLRRLLLHESDQRAVQLFVLGLVVRVVEIRAGGCKAVESTAPSYTV